MAQNTIVIDTNSSRYRFAVMTMDICNYRLFNKTKENVFCLTCETEISPPPSP